MHLTRIAQRGAPSEVMAGLARWRSRAAAQGARAHHKEEAPLEADVNKRTFQHWKNTTSQRWNPPRYSLRRQAELVRAAFQTGDLEAVAASPKFAAFAQRLARQETHELITPYKAQEVPRLSKKQDAEEALRIAQKAHDAGPYAGRSSKRMFKGSNADRASRARARRVQENMTKMDSIVQEWRQDKITEKNKMKPTSPM